MTALSTPGDYLCIEPYLAHFTAAQALRVALRRGLIDVLATQESASVEALAETLTSDVNGLFLLCESLRAVGVLTGDARRYALDARFRRALCFRDLIEAKLDFANVLAPDLIERFQDYVDDFSGFMEKSHVFELFRYDLCYHSSPENLARTRAWMRYTTALTRYEAPVCAEYFDFSDVRRLLDVGGNSGEFARQLCRCFNDLRVEVFDLPVVCEVGREHIAESAETARIRFVSGDAMRDELPSEYDVVAFKSMLHDWPVEAVEVFLDKAARAIRPNGRILIFERGPLDLAGSATNFGLLPMVLFFRNFRSPQVYEQLLRRRGFESIQIATFMLDTPFFVLSASRQPA